MSAEFTFDPQKHEFSANGRIIPSVTQVLSKVGVCDFSYVSREVREYSMNRGSSVHWLLQLEDEGALNPRRIPRKLRGYRKAYLAWKEASGFCPYPQWIERQFVSFYGYAGIIDRVGWFAHNGSDAIVDMKTGGTPDYVKYQLVAYAAFAAPLFKVGPFMRRIALRLNPDGTYKVREFPAVEYLTDWAVFIDFLRRSKCQ